MKDNIFWQYEKIPQDWLLFKLFFSIAFCQFETLGKGDSCYDFYLTDHDTHDWMNAEQLCKDVGMHLITLESVDENQWLNNYLNQAGLEDYYNEMGIWIGYKGKPGTLKISIRVQ